MDVLDKEMSTKGGDSGQKRELESPSEGEPAHKRRTDGSSPLICRPDAATPAGHDSFKAVEMFDVQMNMFSLNVSRMPSIIQRLHFETICVSPDGRTFDLNTGLVAVSGDVNTHNRRLALHIIFRKTFHKKRHLFEKDYHSVVFDNATTAYCPNGVYTGGDEKHKLELRQDDFSEDEWVTVSKLCRRRGSYFKVKMHGSGVVKTSGDELLTDANRMETTRIVELLTSQKLNSGDYYQFGSSTFPMKQNSMMEPDAVSEIRAGFAKVTRLTDGRAGKYEFLMTIDTKLSAFFKATSVLKFMCAKYAESKRGGGSYGGGRDNRGSFGGRNDRGGYGDRRESRGGDRGEDRESDVSSRDVDELERALYDGDGLRNSMGAALKGLYMVATHLPKDSNSIVVIAGISNANAEKSVFTMKDGETERQISVIDYFMEKYQLRLKYPRLPLVFSKRRQHCNFYPMEVLQILPGQRIKLNKMSATIQSAMTGKNSSLPRQHVELVQDILRNSLRLDRNKYMEAFGVSLDKTVPVQVRAKILPPALIRFKNQAYMPKARTPGFRTSASFVEPASIKEVAVVVFDRCLDYRDSDNFCKNFGKYCHDNGITVEVDCRKWEIKEMYSDDNAEIRRKMDQYRDRKIDILVAICREKRPDVHDVLKYYEEKLGMQTIQLCTQTVQKMNGCGGRQTIDNVMRKFNLKCGGTNFFVDIPRDVDGRLVCSNTETLRAQLLDNVQFIGFEISHGASRTLYDRSRSQMDGEPSVVGVSYSLKNSTSLGGFTYLQTAKQYKLEELSTKFPECVRAYKAVAKRLPAKICIYRVGMGEGDFKRIGVEIDEIRATFEQIQPGYRPDLVVIVAQRNSHTRVFPKIINGSNARDQNVPSGTCIEGGVTSFGTDEFILVSQSALIGTVRPCKYTILLNEAKWSKNEIVHLTYFRACGHQVSYQPPTVPDVLYAAENLAKRGRNNWVVHKKMESLQEVERKVLAAHPELDTEEMEAELASAIISDISERINEMTISKRNFWA